MNDMIYGINAVREGLKGRRKPLELFVNETSRNKRIDEIVAEAKKRSVPVRFRRRLDLDRLVGLPHHQNVVLCIEPYQFFALHDLLENIAKSSCPGFLLLLDEITDPGNLGAILRNAEAAGCHGVILTKDRSCGITAIVDKASAGAAEHLRVCQVTNLSQTIQKLKNNGFWIYGLDVDSGSQSIYEADFCSAVALVIGSEGKGLRLRTRQLCDVLLHIPMQGHVLSLNAASASAISLFEVVRQRI